MNKSVSIITPTYDQRTDFLQFIARGICKQTYTNIKEWVIVDGTKKEYSPLPETIKKIEKLKNIPKIVYIPNDPKRKNTVGNLRNIAKNKASGDILIHFDDDDFYPECRIKHAVEQLNRTGKEIAGNSDLYMYDVHFKTLYQFRSFGPNHILGGTMAYTKNYANKHTFDEEVTHAEEGSFTNRFKEPAAVLDAKKSIIASSHGINTYSKKKIIWDNLYSKDSKRQTMFTISRTLRSVSKNKKYIKDYLRVIENSVEKRDKKYDITIFDGMETIYSKYIYYDMIHEQAVYLQSLGYTVEIYSNNKKFKTQIETLVDGVVYKYYCQFNISKKYNIVIWSSLTAAIPFLTNKIRLQTNKTILYNPDFREGIGIYKQYLDEIDTIVLDNPIFQMPILAKLPFKDYEKQDWKKKTKFITNSFTHTTNVKNYSKINNSFYICLYYEECVSDFIVYLKFIFPKLHELNRNVSFHIYNFEILENSKIKKEDLEEIKSKGYYHIYRSKNYNDILQEKYKYKFHFCLYQNYGSSHLSVCDVRHSLYINCIPIIYKDEFMIFKEFKCFICTIPIPFKLNDLFVFLSTIMKFGDERRLFMENHNSKIFDINYTQKNWGKKFLNLIK